MEERKRPAARHTVSMEERERIYLTGVLDVLSFDEESILAETQKGLLILRGNNLHVARLNLEDGEVAVDGLIISLEYSEDGQPGKHKTSLLAKIFR